ncbi:hypothetical protein E4U43_000551 [Claviceps pusilla]|uniref:Ubiquinone/menaquinone biosynthesis-related protein n=1 Tax=Claviceps pusilla TaxID=123648 RepID=A0A9P7N9T7_9HYPO|nr:hypothetical protein E4U43_000551 [Claviceps pusilla]
MSVTTARGLVRPGWLPWRQGHVCASTSSRASQPPSAHARKTSRPHAVTPPRITRPYKPAAQKPTPNPSSINNPQPDSLQALWRRSWLPLSGAALLAGFLGFYIVGTAAASLREECPCGASSSSASSPREHTHDDDTTPTGRPPALTGHNAEQFDQELDFPEWWMGITKLRRRLAEHARGHVLELAMGTGRNLEYYRWDDLDESDSKTGTGTGTGTRAPNRRGITSFTGLDISVDMLDVARKRLTRAVPPLAHAEPVVQGATMADHTGGQLAFLNNRLRLVHSDAHRALPPLALPGTASSSSSSSSSSSTTTTMTQSPPRHYDTIIQTFGLCSVSDPIAVLCNLASAIKPHTGRIVLLEHGKGWFGLVNGLLDRNARKHFDKYGCWWNRDIEALVEEAVRRTPGLEVVRLERPNWLQMGTLVWVELRVRA